MLGVVQNPTMTPSDVAEGGRRPDGGGRHLPHDTGRGLLRRGCGETSPDPFFGGVGPERTGCIECGECMTGCRHNAKNTLPKNYLGLAERAGAQVFPLTRAIELRPPRAGGGGSGGEDGTWRVVTKRTGRPGGRRVFTADQVVVAAGTYSTQKLLHRMKTDGVLPKLSDRLGFLSRTNSRSRWWAQSAGPPARTTRVEWPSRPASTRSRTRTSSRCAMARGSNAMGLMQTVLTDEEPGTHRARTWLREVVQQRRSMAKLLNVRKWSERGVIALVMQDLDNSVTVTGKRTRFGRFKMSSRQGRVSRTRRTSPSPTRRCVGLRR